MPRSDLGLIVRPLREADREDILEISKHTWEGHDYLPYYLDKWLSDSESHTFVLEIEGRVVSIANLHIIERGRTGWMEGLRVHPSYRGRGFASIMTQHIVKAAHEHGVQRIRYTTASDNIESLHLASAIGMSIKVELGIFWHEDLESISWKHSNREVKPVTHKELPTSIYESDLFPYGVVVHDWKAFDASPESLEEMNKTTRFWIQKDNDDIISFSVGGDRYEGSDRYWGVAIYAKQETDFLDHLAYHLSMATGKYSGLFAAYPVKFIKTISSFDWAYDTHDRTEEEMRMLLLERIL